MTLDEAIKHVEKVAEAFDKLCKQYDNASRYFRSHNEDIVSANAKKCLECFECAKEHRQLAEWLKELKQLREQTLKLPKNTTNGEIIRALFPNIDKAFSNVIDLNLWWNAKYKGTGEIQCNHTDAEIAKSFIEDVEAVKDLLPQERSE